MFSLCGVPLIKTTFIHNRTPLPSRKKSVFDHILHRNNKKLVGFDQFHNFPAPHQPPRPRTHLVPWNTHISQTFLHKFWHAHQEKKKWWERQMELLDILQIILWIARVAKRKASISCDSYTDSHNANPPWMKRSSIDQTHEWVCAVNLLDVRPEAQSGP
jgi:hypothetical protein